METFAHWGFFWINFIIVICSFVVGRGLVGKDGKNIGFDTLVFLFLSALAFYGIDVGWVQVTGYFNVVAVPFFIGILVTRIEETM